MVSNVLTVVCAWCQCVVTAPPSAGGVTHTICRSCLATLFDSPAGEEIAAAADDLDDLRS